MFKCYPLVKDYAGASARLWKTRMLNTLAIVVGTHIGIAVDQGGIYTLPSHLSPGARDLIPRMLLVDPMKRVTIPEIRQHTWFLNHLPRYLAVPPPDTTQQAKRVRVLPNSLSDLHSNFLNYNSGVPFPLSTSRNFLDW